MAEEGYKTCSKCGAEKPLTEFYLTRKNRLNACKVCRKAQIAEWNRRNPEKRSAATKRYKQRNPEKERARVKRNPEKYKARYTLRNAVRRGRIRKPDCCEDCQKPTQLPELQAHHDDYSKPLEVAWLCRACHRRRHLKAA